MVKSSSMEPSELQKLQECDPTLGNIRQHAREEAELDKRVGFLLPKGPTVPQVAV